MVLLVFDGHPHGVQDAEFDHALASIDVVIVGPVI
jgi:hypothetical protein